MTTAISMKWTCPLADCAWKTVGSLRSRRWRTGDESVSVVRWGAASDDETSPVAAVRRTPSPECSDLPDGRDTCGGGALPSHGGNSSQRRRRRPVETLWRRHGARPAAVEERGFQSHFALEPSLSVRPETAILYRVLQRHLQRRREPDGDNHCPVPAPARRSPRAAPSDRAKLRASAGAAWDRQSHARGDCSIHRRTGLFDCAPGDSGQNPQPCGGQAIREDDGARRRRVIPGLDEGHHYSLRYTCDWH